MECYECNTKSNESILSCSCGKIIHIMCLHKATILSLNWSNVNPPKYVLDIFKSPNFKFNCLNCINSYLSGDNTNSTESSTLKDINNNILTNTKLVNIINHKFVIYQLIFPLSRMRVR